MQRNFTVTLLLILVTIPSQAFSDFYVIAVGKKAVRTVLVSPKSIPTQSGEELLAALNKISDASETNPYLVVIEPGIYDEGSTPVVMKEHVDIQGSGQGMTTIKGGVIGSNTGLIVGAHMTELRHLTIKNTGAGGEVAAIHNESTLMRVTEVTAEARGGGGRILASET